MSARLIKHSRLGVFKFYEDGLGGEVVSAKKKTSKRDKRKKRRKGMRSLGNVFFFFFKCRDNAINEEEHNDEHLKKRS